MKHKIKENFDNTEMLEKLYRADKKAFERDFFNVYSEMEDSQLAKFWKIRLESNHPGESRFKFEKNDLIYLILSCVISGFLIKIPDIFGLNSDKIFFAKNGGLIVILGLSIFTMLTKSLYKPSQLVKFGGTFVLSAVYINMLPSTLESASINLAYIHLPLLLWCMYGVIFMDFDTKDRAKRMDYIRFNGDLIVLTTIILAAGGLLVVISSILFEAIGIRVTTLYMDYIVLWGLVSAPIVATGIIQKYPNVTNKIAPIIATIFSPIVLITLIIYLISIPFAGKNPYNDRNFLLIFNVMLLGVMALIVFSISELSIRSKQKFSEVTLLSLAVVTLIINMVALSAIIYRLGEFGFTPNRVTVLGSNLLIFGNLIWIAIDLFKVNFKKAEIHRVELTLSNYLPYYVIWALIGTFGFPVLFGYK